VESESETELETRAGALLGTVPYMSPEQVEGRGLDARSDLFSLGVVLHEMLAGQHPFRGESVAGWITSILRDEPPPVSSLDARLPDALAELVLACLSKDPAARPASAREVRERLAALGQPGTAGAPAPADGSKVVVVLPFANRSGVPDNEYFSDGLTEEVIADLSHLSGLRTISRNSAMQLKGTDRGTAALARELGVTHLVTGSVRRAGDALRVTVELVEARTDASIWSDKYSGTVEDVFGIQEEIARKIVAALEVELTSAERQRAAERTRAPERPIDDPVAWDCYLRARQEMYVWTSESLGRAHRLVDDALAIVGDAPLLLATKGQLHWNEVNANLAPSEEGLTQAAAYVERALALDAEFPLAFYVRGLVAGMRGDVEAALRDLYLALDSMPGDANVLTEVCRYSNVSGLRGHLDLVERALQIDPLTPVTQLVLSSYRWINGPQEAAVASGRRAIELAPAVGSMLQVIAAWQIADGGEPEEAAGVLRSIGERSPGTPTAAWALFLERAITGDEAGALAAMTPELEAGLRNEFSARMMAQGHARLGRRDDALHWARTAIGYGFVNHPSWTEVDQNFAPLRDDPEFRELMDGIRPRWQALVEWERSLGRGSA
jgi:serine/threonine-protein kinase